MSLSSATRTDHPIDRRRIRIAARHSLALAIACGISYELTTRGLSRVHSLSTADDLLGGMWAVIATVFVYRETNRASIAAALSRSTATLLSFGLCLVYLLLFSFHPLGLVFLIGLGTFILMAVGRDDDVVTAGITTAVVLVVAGISPHDAWEQPILRLVDTAIGITVGIAASMLATRIVTSLERPAVSASQLSLAKTEGAGSEPNVNVRNTPVRGRWAEGEPTRTTSALRIAIRARDRRV
jgi:hypothetical protein